MISQVETPRTARGAENRPSRRSQAAPSSVARKRNPSRQQRGRDRSRAGTRAVEIARPWRAVMARKKTRPPRRTTRSPHRPEERRAGRRGLSVGKRKTQPEPQRRRGPQPPVRATAARKWLRTRQKSGRGGHGRTTAASPKLLRRTRASAGKISEPARYGFWWENGAGRL